ncbi:PWWP domain-containing DNA repair factor 3A isoform X2 [Anolis carolinensis]|uniref:PWWP domain-containing DNA repair factor 3A isoform X2 n=1 Tax=Anolis carolinensis TaxID=28377 RepID=UPI002F2B68FA
MMEAEYVFCKWKRRLWPAKVLSRNPTSGKNDKLKGGSVSMHVEIFGLQKQANVSCAVVQPLKKETIEDISSKLAQSNQSHRCVEREVIYRRALKEALDLLDYASLSRDNPPAQKDTAEQTRRVEEQETGDAPTSLEPTAIENERVLSSVDFPRHVGRPCRAISKAKGPLRSHSAGSKSPCSSKEAIKKHHEAVDSSAYPASVSFTVTSSARAITVGKKTSLLSSPKDGEVSEDGEVTPKGSNDNRNPLNGTLSQNHGTVSPTPKKQRRLFLEDLDLEGPALEGEEEESWMLNGEPSTLPSTDAGEDLEPDLSLSPVRERSFSVTFSSDEEDEELPSFFLPQELGSIEKGKLVWCKVRGYPYWPAVVKNIKRKTKRASVLFIENGMEKKGKGFSISLKSLKHFDCEEKQAFIDAAREKYEHDINWCINLIEDYRIRVGCNSFTGSFLEYCSDAMSFPVRNEGLLQLSLMNFPYAKEEGQGTPSKTPRPNREKKLLPDRTQAARDRANQKLVDFIVKAQGAEGHLQAILRQQKSSRWLAQFLPRRRRLKCTETYLEDEAQQEEVCHYLEGVYRRTRDKVLPRFLRDRVRYILDVLFPEAIIYAIASVEQIEYQKAEEKFSKGPPASKRERYIFEDKIWKERRGQYKPALAEDSP